MNRVKIKSVNGEARTKNDFTAYTDITRNDYSKYTIENDDEFNVIFKEDIIKKHGSLKNYFFGYTKDNVKHYPKNVTIGFEGRQFDLTDKFSEQYLDYLILKNHPYIGKSIQDAKNKNLRFYIHNSENEASSRIENHNYKQKAYTEKSKMDILKMRSILRIMGRNVNVLSNILVEDAINTIIESDAKKFMNIVNIDNFDLRSKLYEFIEHGIIKSIKSRYQYSDFFFENIDQIIEFIKKKENLTILDEWNRQLENIQKGNKNERSIGL